MSLLTLLRYQRRHRQPEPPGPPLSDDELVRMSAINATLPFPFLLPVPTGAVDARDQLMLLNLIVEAAP